MTAARDLCLTTLNSIKARLNLEEITEGEHSGPLYDQNSKKEVGQAKVYSNGKVRVVYVGLEIKAFALDSHMMFAFTCKNSFVPHFTLDSVKVGEDFAFHLDMIPKKDLGANQQYIKSVYSPVSDAYSKGKKINGLIPAHLTPEQLAIMSPWMLASRANSEAFDQIGPVVDSYLEHWLKLVDDRSLDATDETPADRDRKNRGMLFSPEVDPVWNQIERVIGPEAGKDIRGMLKNVH